MNKIKKIVTICGGNGGFSLLRGLKKFDWEVSAVIAMTDDGGSTGRLRRELGVLPPGDVRYCLSALSTLPNPWEKVWNYRFENEGLKGHTAGNILLAGLEKFYGNFLDAVREMGKLLQVKGKVVPATLDNAELCLEFKNKKIIRGQNKINLYEKLQKEAPRRLFISPAPRANPKAVSEILSADVVLIGPGNLYCSILPNLVIREVKDALLKTKALVIYNCNMINRVGQTEGYDLDQYVDVIHQYLERDRIDAVTFNSTSLHDHIKNLKIKEKDIVRFDQKKKSRSFKVFALDLLEKEGAFFSQADEIAYIRSPIRHNGEKVGRAVIEIYNKLRKQ
jgi:uncharacterized cofD-like protein